MSSIFRRHHASRWGPSKWRSQGLAFIGIIAVTGIIMASGTPGPMKILLITLWTSSVIYTLFNLWQFLGLMARLRDSRFSLCPNCRYDLSRGPAAGRCPECGTAYNLREVRAWWRRQYGKPQSGPAEPRA